MAGAVYFFGFVPLETVQKRSDRVAQGLYRITDTGNAYLDEELDASELEQIEDTDEQ